MVSAQVPCILRFYLRKPSGNLIKLTDGRIEFFGPGGSSQGGIPSTTTPDKLLNQALDQGHPISRGDQLVLAVISDAAKTITASKCTCQIPFRDGSGGNFTVVNTMLTFSGSTIAVPAATEVNIATYTFQQEPYFFGGNKIFMSIEDNA